jgi:hypothetical protein
MTKRNYFISSFLFLFFFILFSFNSSKAFTLPEKNIQVGSPVYIEDINSSLYYAVFLPSGNPTNSEVCATMSGDELVEDNNLRNYGTCFINDAGVFKIVEIYTPFSSSYDELKESDQIVQEEEVALFGDAGKSFLGIQLLGELFETTSSTQESSLSLNSILGVATSRLFYIMAENNLTIIVGSLIVVTFFFITKAILIKNRKE